MDEFKELSDFLGTQIEKLNSIKMKQKTPQEGNTCLQMYDGRMCKCEVIAVNDEESCFDVITSFGAKMYNIPFNKFKPYDLDELIHFKDTSIGLWCIDRDPKEVSKEWIESNAFQLSAEGEKI